MAKPASQPRQQTTQSKESGFYETLRDYLAPSPKGLAGAKMPKEPTELFYRLQGVMAAKQPRPDDAELLQAQNRDLEQSSR